MSSFETTCTGRTERQRGYATAPGQETGRATARGHPRAYPVTSMTARRDEPFARIAPPLEGSLVRLRAVEEEDLARLSELVWDPEVTRHLAVVWPDGVAGTRAWWEGARADPHQVVFAIETLPGELVGACDLRDAGGRARQAGLGIFVGRPYWERGYGTDAVRTVCRFAFREMNLQRVQLDVYEINPRGRRAYEKVGFRKEGRLRRAHFVDGRSVDVIVMGLLAEELIER